MATAEMQTQVRFERILLATDFSSTSMVAQAYAVGLAIHDLSVLELTTVIDLSLSLPAMNVLSAEALEAMRRAGEEQLQDLADHIPEVRVTTKVIEGFLPAVLIVDEAVSSNADLIVLGTSSKHGLKKLALGSTAEEVIRSAPCPTLTVGPNVALPPNGGISFKRIIYATDFSDQAKNAAGLAQSLAQTSGGYLYICHVTREDGVENDKDAVSIGCLESMLGIAADQPRRAEIIVEHGKAAEAILTVAARVNADLIVVGPRKSSLWLEYVRTGVTPSLLTAAKCPVLTLS